MDLAVLRRACINWGRYFGLDWEDAEDGAQEIIFRAWRSSAEFPDAQSLYAFSRQAMRNWAIDQNRRPGNRVQTVSYEAWAGRTEPLEPASNVLQWLVNQCRDDADRVTLAAMMREYTASEQAQCWPGLFASVNDAYNARRNLRGRMIRASITDLSAPDDLSERKMIQRR